MELNNLKEIKEELCRRREKAQQKSLISKSSKNFFFGKADGLNDAIILIGELMEEKEKSEYKSEQIC